MTPRAKLTPTDLTKIRVMRKYGMTYAAIAAEFNVTLQCIFYALNGRR